MAAARSGDRPDAEATDRMGEIGEQRFRQPVRKRRCARDFWSFGGAARAAVGDELAGTTVRLA